MKTITLVDDRQVDFFDAEMQKVYEGHVEATLSFQERADKITNKINRLISARDQLQTLANDQNGRAQAILSIQVE